MAGVVYYANTSFKKVRLVLFKDLVNFQNQDCLLSKDQETLHNDKEVDQ